MIIKKIKVNDHILGNDLDALEITIEKKQVILKSALEEKKAEIDNLLNEFNK